MDPEPCGNNVPIPSAWRADGGCNGDPGVDDTSLLGHQHHCRVGAAGLSCITNAWSQLLHPSNQTGGERGKITQTQCSSLHYSACHSAASFLPASLSEARAQSFLSQQIAFKFLLLPLIYIILIIE